MSGALEGVRVIDFGQYIAGPLLALMLAEQGADVIHVDPPEGPRWKTPADAFYSRSKRRLSLDLKQPSDLAVAHRLIDGADVVVENFRPGVMERFGVGPQLMTERNPALIYCSLPGFASDDPRAGLAAWEGVVCAAAGTYRPLQEGKDAPERADPTRPAYTAITIASNFAAFVGATATVMALIARHRTGLGQRLEVPLFDAMFEVIGPHGISTGRMASTRGDDPFGRGHYLCGDGRYIQFSPFNPRFLVWFVNAAGHASWGEEGLLDAARLPKEPELSELLRSRLRALFLTRSAWEWETVAEQAGAPMSVVRTSAEWLANEHARASGAVVQLADPGLGSAWMTGLPVHLTGRPGGVKSPRHLPDADRAQIVAELNRPRQALRLRANEPDLRWPLQGVRVLDLTQVLAGPTGGRVMGEFGAEVIKINSPFAHEINQHEFVNRGKRSLLLNLQSPDGQRVFWRLVDQADMVMQNFPLGTAERYGIGYEQVRARKPDIVYASASAYGYGGPRGPRRGYEMQGQATSGLLERFGRGGPPVPQPFLVNDYGTGWMYAFSMALGLYHRFVTGEGQHVQASLAQTATYQQTPYMLDYAGKQWDEPRGRDALGSAPLHRLYKAKDAWFFLGAAPDQQADLELVLGLHDLAELRGAALEQALERQLALQPAAVWIQRLQAAGIGAHGLVPVKELMADPWVRAHGLSVTQTLEGLGEVTMPGFASRLSRTPLRLGEPSRPPGSDAAAVLASVGLGDSLDQLVRDGDLRTPARDAVGA